MARRASVPRGLPRRSRSGRIASARWVAALNAACVSRCEPSGRLQERPQQENFEHLPTVDGFDLEPCWTDDMGDRSLAGSEFRTDNITVQQWRGFLSELQLLWCRLRERMFCGDALGSEAAPEADSGHVSVGNSLEWCGTGSGLNVYSVRQSTMFTAATSTSDVATATETSTTT